jgi:glycerophosphoryl diester phosphodiesterase
MRPRRALPGCAVLVSASLAAFAFAVPASAERGGAADDRRADRTTTTEGPLIIGHRGASGYRPEHTLAAYQLAIDLGADFIEPDLVATKDGVLVARHENEISETTDVESHPAFADRHTTKTIDGRSVTGWFTEDFTLAELKTLRAEERLPDLRQENTVHDGRYEIPTFDEVVALATSNSTGRARPIGVYPETKHPTYFDSIGLSLEEPLVETLRGHGLADRNAPVFVQSFETENLRDLDTMVQVPLVQLIGGGSGGPADGSGLTYAHMSTAAGLRTIATYADGVGPDKNRVIPVAADGSLGAPTTFVRDAHAVDLLVHPYTIRAENAFLPPALRSSAAPADYGDVLAELEAFYDAGVDGVFTDQPDLAVVARSMQDAA